MNRRTFVLGLGTIATGSAAAVGSGAFTSVEADRNISVETADDSAAFLQLDALGANERSMDGDRVSFSFPSQDETLTDDEIVGEGDNPNPQNPQGLGSDSVYRFASDVNGGTLLRITNSGTQPVDVFARQDDIDPDEPEVTLFDVDADGSGLLTPESPHEDLGVGEELKVGFQIDTTDVDVDGYTVTLTIVADADHETDD